MVGSIESMVSNIAQENQKILSCDSFRNWSCSLHLKSIGIHRHNSVNVSHQPMKSENKEKGPRSRVSPPPTAEPHLPSVAEMKNRLAGGPRLHNNVAVISAPKSLLKTTRPRSAQQHRRYIVLPDPTNETTTQQMEIPASFFY